MNWAILLTLFLQEKPLFCFGFAGDSINQRRPRYRPQKIAITDAEAPRVRGVTTVGRRIISPVVRTDTQLSLHPTTGASIAIVSSSLFGMQISRLIPSGGILGTLVSAAVFGNVCNKWVPNVHPLYDLCFSLFLPGSLTLLLLAYRSPESDDDIDDPGAVTQHAQDSISACIRRIAMPFCITSLASLTGCWLSYRSALYFRWFQEGTGAAGAIAAKASELAKITTGCMSASYVGGSVNFMSTARIVGAPATLLGSLVTADLFTMAIYFSFLSSSLDWKWLVSKFAQDRKVVAKNGDGNSLPLPTTSSTAMDVPSFDLQSFCRTSIPLLVSTFFIVQVANRVEDFLGQFVPGTACALIAIVAPLLNSLVQARDFWKPYSRTANVWSDFFFLSFFASIGVAANLSSALSMGPACIFFSLIALTVHVIGTVFGCLLWKKVMMAFHRLGHRTGTNAPSLDLEDVWIASNAAIGGPATAAAFCGCMVKRDPKKLKGRTIAATVWGVVGYAIGTIVGVSMYRML